jgi:hypothetical protein
MPCCAGERLVASVTDAPRTSRHGASLEDARAGVGFAAHAASLEMHAAAEWLILESKVVIHQNLILGLRETLNSAFFGIPTYPSSRLGQSSIGPSRIGFKPCAEKGCSSLPQQPCGHRSHSSRQPCATRRARGVPRRRARGFLLPTRRVGAWVPDDVSLPRAVSGR